MPENETHWQAQARMVAGRYQLLRQLGRGGMGTVWLADDQLTGRQVAVKELRPPPGLPDAERETYGRRALQEARSAARVHHPNAVTLYDVLPATPADEALYLILELVKGPTLAQIIQRDGALPERTVAAYGLQLLSVLETAHGLGIVHRDIKPGNILVSPEDQAKLSDFGIAHAVGDTRLTRSGVMGTQAYMAPELFSSVPITPAADLWSLGATLYHAAEGQGPFERDTTAATLRAVLLDDLPVPHRASRLAAAITGMLQRDPVHRATIGQARNDLRQAIAVTGTPAAGETRDGQAESAAPGWDQVMTTRSPGASVTEPRATPREPPADPAAPPRASHRIPVVWTTIAAGIIIVAVAITISVLATGSTAKPHPSPTGPLPSEQPLAVLQDLGSTKGVNSVTFSPDGRTLAAEHGDPGEPGTISLWDTEDHKELSNLSFHVTTGAAFSPDGRMLAFGVDNTQVDLWDIADRKVVAQLPDPYVGENASTVAFSPDGKALAFADDTGHVYVWNIENHKMAATLPAPPINADVNALMFSPDGKTLAAGDPESLSVSLWNITDHSMITTISGFTGSATSPGYFAFSPDGKTLATYFGSIQLWNAMDGETIATLPGSNPFPGEPGLVAFDPKGELLAGADAVDGSIKLWNVTRRKAIGALTESDSGTVSAVAFSPNGGTLATADRRGQICLWNVTSLATVPK